MRDLVIQIQQTDVPTIRKALYRLDSECAKRFKKNLKNCIELTDCTLTIKNLKRLTKTTKVYNHIFLTNVNLSNSINDNQIVECFKKLTQTAKEFNFTQVQPKLLEVLAKQTVCRLHFKKILTISSEVSGITSKLFIFGKLKRTYLNCSLTTEKEGLIFLKGLSLANHVKSLHLTITILEKTDKKQQLPCFTYIGEHKTRQSCFRLKSSENDLMKVLFPTVYFKNNINIKIDNNLNEDNFWKIARNVYKINIQMSYSNVCFSLKRLWNKRDKWSCEYFRK